MSAHDLNVAGRNTDGASDAPGEYRPPSPSHGRTNPDEQTTIRRMEIGTDKPGPNSTEDDLPHTGTGDVAPPDRPEPELPPATVRD